MIRRIRQWTIVLVVMMLTSSMAFGQQEPQYTQFMFNKLPINAAYTGANEVMSIRALYRNQWTGINGHPQNVSFSIHSPLKNENLALGFYFVNDRLGQINQNWFDMTYAYRIPLGGKMRLSFGVNAGLLYYKHNVQDLNFTQSGDPLLMDNVSRVMPDVGAGFYLSDPDKFYVGFSVPNFIKSDFYNSREVQSTSGLVSQRLPHMFAMAGGVIPLGSSLKIKPQTLFKHILSTEYQSPFSMDFNLSFLIMDRVNIGGGYRTTFGKREEPDKLINGDSFMGMVEFWATKQFMIGYAYDYTLSDLGVAVGSGTHEIIMGFDFSFDKKRIITPRYF